MRGEGAAPACRGYRHSVRYSTHCAVLCIHVCDCHSHGHLGLAIFAEFELLQLHLKQQSGPRGDSVLDPLQSGTLSYYMLCGDRVYRLT